VHAHRSEQHAHEPPDDPQVRRGSVVGRGGSRRHGSGVGTSHAQGDHASDPARRRGTRAGDRARQLHDVRPAADLGSLVHPSRDGTTLAWRWPVVDTSALYGASEANVGEYARALGITNELFLADKSWNCGEYAFDPSHAQRQFARSLERLSRERLDVVGIHSMTNVGMILPILRSLKSQGKIRYVGVTSHEPYQYAGMEPLIVAGAVDFIQVRYSIFQRVAEDRLLPLARKHGVAVMVNMALEKGRLHHAVGSRPLPRFADDFGCTSWAEFFLKYVVAHPAVTCVVQATTNPDHAAQNLTAMYGPLPDAATRRRMIGYLRQLPAFHRLAATPWYPGKTFTGGLVQLPNPHPAG
jgi:diketogulonate reductase-like aldo/keto reductase